MKKMETMMNPGDKDPKEFDSFFLAFAGQNVILTMDIVVSQVHSSESGTITENIPMFYEGILLDYDDQNYYLGKTPTEITDFVPKNRVIHGKINEGDEEIMNEVLNQIPIPTNESEVN
jgi:hypothetical protein